MKTGVLKKALLIVLNKVVFTLIPSIVTALLLMSYLDARGLI